MLADLGDVLKRLLVGVDEEFGRLEMTAQAVDDPDSATDF